MGKVIVIEHLTLDGVMQAAGHPTRIRVTGSSTAAGRAGATTRPCRR